MIGRRVHRSATLVLSAVMAVIGVALIVEAIAGTRHGSVPMLLVLGILFVLAGGGRAYVERRRGRGT